MIKVKAYKFDIPLGPFFVHYGCLPTLTSVVDQISAAIAVPFTEELQNV
jgi:hypothetical protein